jgi:hypothetical protein
VQTSYEDEAELVNLFEGVETVLCFFAVLNDPGNVVQKRIIDASIKAGVKRYAPAEWATYVVTVYRSLQLLIKIAALNWKAVLILCRGTLASWKSVII